MADKVTVTTRHSYGSRVKNSFGKIGLGVLFVLWSIWWIFLNEKNFLETKVALKEWAEIVQETVSTEINAELDQKEVHLFWETSSPAESLKDSTFWIVTDDLKLKREVEMYQWLEKSEEHCTDNIGWSEDCETTYTYYKGWEDHAVDSNNFYEAQWHENPLTRKYQSQEWEKSPILVWVYTLSNGFASKLSNYKNLDLSSQNIIVPDEYKWTNSDNTVESNNDSYLYWNNSKFHIKSNYIYIGEDETSPKLWDLKITFTSVKTWTISIVWKQDGDNLTSYTASNWKSIELLSEWKVSAEEMFIAAQKANKMMTWFLRWFLLVLMFAWFSMIFEFITTLTKVLPFLSRIVGVWTKTIAFALTLVFGFLAIWISRLAVRPVVWICCLVIVIAWIVMLVRAKKNKKTEKWNDTTKKDDKNLEIIEA